MTAPDQFSWTLLLQVVQPAATPGNNNVLFETWASDQDTFKAQPSWPGATPSQKRLKAPALHRTLRAAPNTAKGVRPLVLPFGGKAGEEVRRNLVAHQFIVQNNLYTQAGLAAWFASGKKMAFPVDSIEIKANWIPVDDKMDSSVYHTNKASDGKLYALVSMHLISKAVPIWTWATFEHTYNPGRCDYIGCRDTFGATIPFVPPQSQAGQKYPGCAKNDALQKLFAATKVSPVFLNYCLKGSQTDFTDPTGIPTLLGNSVTEVGFVNTSSCLTCHARAAFNAKGEPFPIPGFLDPPPPAHCPSGPKAPCSPNGTPKPSWFWQNPKAPDLVPIYVQADFVWAIPFCAIPTGKSPPCALN